MIIVQGRAYAGGIALELNALECSLVSVEKQANCVDIQSAGGSAEKPYWRPNPWNCH